MNIIIGLLVGVAFFLSTITAYILGIRHKAQIIQNIVPFTPLESAINKVEEVFENKKDEKIESTREKFGIRW